MMAFAFGAFIGFVGLVSRLVSSGLSIKATNEKPSRLLYFYLFTAPLTFLLEFAMAFPFDVNIYDISSASFQTNMLVEGRHLLELHCLRIISAALAIVIITLGSLVSLDTNIFAPYCVGHIMVGASYLAIVHANQRAGVNGGFMLPAFLHFAAGIANGLNFARSYRSKVHAMIMGLFPKTNEEGGRLKQE